MEKETFCICGSSRRFDMCCKPYIDKTYEDFEKELKANNNIKAYYIAIGMLSNYLFKVKEHTPRLLKERPVFGAMLLEADIKAFKELMHRIYALMFKNNIEDNWGQRTENLKRIVKTDKWEQACSFFQLLFYNTNNQNGQYNAEIQKILTSVNVKQISDVDYLMELYSACTLAGGLTQVLEILDMIITLTDDEFLKIKHKFAKAVWLFLYSDYDAAQKEADETIVKLEGIEIDSYDTYQVSMVAQIYEMYYNFTMDANYLNLSYNYLEKIDMSHFNARGKALHYSQRGYVKWRLNEFEIAKQFFELSLQYENNTYAQIYLLDCKVALKEVVSLVDYMKTLQLSHSKEDSFEYAYILGNAAIGLNDIKSMQIIKKYIKGVDLKCRPYFNNCIKELEVELEKRTGNLRTMLGKLKSISKYLILEPNINGIGINLNKMIDDITEED